MRRAALTPVGRADSVAAGGNNKEDEFVESTRSRL